MAVGSMADRLVARPPPRHSSQCRNRRRSRSSLTWAKASRSSGRLPRGVAGVAGSVDTEGSITDESAPALSEIATLEVSGPVRHCGARQAGGRRNLIIDENRHTQGAPAERGAGGGVGGHREEAGGARG